jgi:hypothetical protein
MCGKKIIKNLVAALTPLFDVPVYPFDQNARRDLPCVVVGYDRDEQTREGLAGHYTVGGFVMAAVNGYDDASNEQADALADDAIEALCDDIEAAINAPDEGEDERPARDFHCNKLFVRGTEREEADSSTLIFVKWDAFTRNSD